MTDATKETAKTFYVTKGNIAFGTGGKRIAGQAIELNAAHAKKLLDAGVVTTDKPKTDEDE